MLATGGRDLGHDPDLTALIVGLYKSKPYIRPRPIDWNLGFVLQVLKGPPFEPLRQAAFKWMTFKTLFLVAFASSRRRGELHALIVDHLAHTDQWQSCTIFSDPTFLSKTHVPTRGTGLPPLTIPALPVHDAPEADDDGASLCPVRAVRVYVERSATYRGARRKLFISHDVKHLTELAPGTLSSYLRSTVSECYARSSTAVRATYTFTPHSIRSFATSWAVTHRASVADVMGAAMWRAPTTFTKFYLRDVTNITSDMNRLGPVVAALSIV